MRSTTVAELNVEAGVKAALQRFLREAMIHAQLRRIVLYGSAARGEMGPESDVDLLVEWNDDESAARAVLSKLTTDIFIESGILISTHHVDPAHRERLESISTRFYRNVQREGLALAG